MCISSIWWTLQNETSISPLRVPRESPMTNLLSLGSVSLKIYISFQSEYIHGLYHGLANVFFFIVGRNSLGRVCVCHWISFYHRRVIFIQYFDMRHFNIIVILIFSEDLVDIAWQFILYLPSTDLPGSNHACMIVWSGRAVLFHRVAT